MYRLEPENTEKEWEKYHWKITDLTNKKGNQIATPECVKLIDLVQKAELKK